MSDPRIRKFIGHLYGVERRVLALETKPQLAYSSIEDGAVDSNDADGNLGAQFGKQWDGTQTGASLSGPKPPQSSKPNATGGAGGITVQWDGLYAEVDDVAPMDFARVDVHTSTVSGFDAVATPPKASITSPRGGEVFISLPPGVWYVALVIRSESGKASLQSAEVSAESSASPSGEDVQAALDAAQGAVTAANGKNTNYRQPQQPAGPNTPGDLWFITSADNVPYVWDGTTWVQTQLGDAAIRYLDAAKISVGTLTGILIEGNLFRSSTSNKYIEIGDTGGGDPTDEMRMFNTGTVASIRNPTDLPGALRLSLPGAAFDFEKLGDGHRTLRGSPQCRIKFLDSISGLQVRTGTDNDYRPIRASEFNVGTSLSERKRDIEPIPVDAAAVLETNGLKRWTWREPEPEPQVDSGPKMRGSAIARTAGTQDDAEEPISESVGLLADDMPEWMRSDEGYSVTAVVGFLWEALKQSNDRIAALEARLEETT